MKDSTLLAGETSSPFFPLAAVLFAVAIFAVDTFTPLGIAVAVLYVVVVLMAGRFFQRTGVLIVGFACVALTILSYVLQHGETYGPALIRCLVSLAAIGITTFLALRIQAAGSVLREQADLLEITHDAIFVRDMNDIITFWNRGAEQLYGWPREEAVGRIAHELIRTVFPEPLPEIKTALIRDDRWEGELIHTKRDGTEVVVASRWSMQRNRAGRPVAILETNNDITDRKRTEDALRESEANLADAQRLSRTGSFAWDVATGNVRWSAEAYRIFEHDPSIKPTVDLVVARTHPDDRAAFLSALERVVREERQNWEVEHRIVMADGSVKDIHVVAHASNNESGLEYIGAFVDVTEAKNAQQALQHAQAELAHVTRVMTLGELTASIAHEVNQPLAAVVTNAESSLRWLGRDPPELDEGRAGLKRIIRDAHRASQVVRRIRDLVTYSVPARSPMDINEAIRETLTLLEPEILRHQVMLRVDLGKVPPVPGDRVQLQQVIINLVMNGVEAMEKVDDRVHALTITSRPVDPGRILVAVQDSGIGLDPNASDQLFKAFYTTKKGGMGMGLSICRSIIEAHEGELWSSAREDGPGAIFQFTLPLHPETMP